MILLSDLNRRTDMRKAFLLICLIAASGLANAALVDRYTGQPFRFWLNDGRVQASTINAIGTNTQAIVRGQGNTVRNSVGLIRSGTIIGGRVNINAVARGASAVAIGSGNTATNDIGTIGGW
jgi:hypothetical protein